MTTSTISPERLEKDARRVLENPFWISGLKTNVTYERLHDDHDGTEKGKVIVYFLENGDAVLSTDGHRGDPLRFRTFGGGGLSLRVRNALMLLALAIKLDNKDDPQCTCPKKCDCESPPPKDWNGKGGSYKISDFCPVHNENPRPAANCPVHN